MAEEEKQSQADKKKKWSLKKKIIVILGIIVVVIIVTVITANTATQAPLKVSNELVADIQAKNANNAYQLFSTEAKATFSQSHLEQVVNQVGPILNGKPKLISKEASGETGKAATAKIVYEIQGSDGLTYVTTINLTKENGVWKVLNFDNSKK